MREKIIAQALKDPKFLAALKNDANAVVEKELGVKIPAGVKISVVEDSASTVHLVLPPAKISGALSDKELGAVAGGGAWTACLDQSSNYRSTVNSK